MNLITGQKYLWKVPVVDQNTVLSIASSYSLSFAVAQLLVHRKMITADEIDSYLFSSFEKDVSHPSRMKDAAKAVQRIIQAIENKEKILIFGDYDVDGITSSALMMICLLPLGAQVNFFLPHRTKDGYGLSTKIVERAAANGYKLIITVDNGITAFTPAQRAHELGIDLIITDHHKPHDHLPHAYAVVDPHQHDCPYPFKYFAGVGVGFKIMNLLYEHYKKEIPEKAYELLLLGTVADVVPLVGENRFWVRHGLHYINNHESLSLKTLKQNGKIDTKERLSATDIGFSLTPQINALGRLEDPRQGVSFLIGSDENQVKEVGAVLLELNQARKEIEKNIIQDIVSRVEAGLIDIKTENIIIAHSDTWPAGVIGLVASRIVGLYGKPVLLFHITSSGLAKGSCRSIPEFNMFQALESCKNIIEQFGGHPMAAGLSIKLDNLSELKRRLEERIAAQLTPFDLQPKLSLDAELSLADMNKKILSDMQLLEPFGNENPQPLFYVKRVMIAQKPTLLKEIHVKCSVFADGIIKQVIFFNRPDIYHFLLDNDGVPFDIAATISQNEWNGRINIELMGIDIALSQDVL